LIHADVLALRAELRELSKRMRAEQ